MGDLAGGRQAQRGHEEGPGYHRGVGYKSDVSPRKRYVLAAGDYAECKDTCILESGSCGAREERKL